MTLSTTTSLTPQPGDRRRYPSYYSKGPRIAAGQVRLADGWYAPVDSVFAGDRVATSDGGSARVERVVVTRCQDQVESLVELEDGVFVTPACHPAVRTSAAAEQRHCSDDGNWKFPSDLAPVKLLPCSRVYSFVLEPGASNMIVGPYEISQANVRSRRTMAAVPEEDFAETTKTTAGRQKERRAGPKKERRAGPKKERRVRFEEPNPTLFSGDSETLLNKKQLLRPFRPKKPTSLANQRARH